MDTTKSLFDLLSWLIYSGGAILVASWVLARIPSFEVLASETKRLINMGVSVVLALGAYAIITYVPAATFAMLNPWFQIVAGIVVLYSAQQTVHQLTK
jgi:hypothetical protein